MVQERLETLAKSCHEKLQADPRIENLAKQLLYLFVGMEDYARADKLVSLYRGNSVFQQSIEWHRCLSRAYKFCLERNIEDKGMTEYVLGALFSFDSYLTILHHSRNESSLDETLPVLWSFDQMLWKLCCVPSLTPAAEVMRDHFLGQLAYHIAVVLLRKAEKEYLPKDEAIGLSSLVLLFAQKLGGSQRAVIANKEDKAMLDKLKHDAKYRVIQANLTLRNWSSSTSKEEYVVRGHVYSSKIREKIFNKVFPEEELILDSSCWLNADVFKKLPATLSSIDEILTETDLCSFMSSCRFSIHNLVWLGVQSLLLNVSGKANPILPPMYNCWDVAQLGNISFQNPVTEKLETLSSVDIDTFLYLTIYSCYFAVKDNKPSMLLSDVMPCLPTEAQCQFWTAVWTLRGNRLTIDSTATLIRGIETVRLTGQHGLDVELMIGVARTFTDHAEKVLQPCFEADISSMKNRAHLFWNRSIERLKMPNQNQEHTYPENVLFPYRSKLSEKCPAEIGTLIVEGRSSIADEDDLQDDLDPAMSRTKNNYSHGEENYGDGEMSDYSSHPMQTTLDTESNFSDSGETYLHTDEDAQSEECLPTNEPKSCTNKTCLEELAASQFQLVKIMEKLADKLESLEKVVVSDFQLVQVIDKLADKVEGLESSILNFNTMNLHRRPEDLSQLHTSSVDLLSTKSQSHSMPNQVFFEPSTLSSCGQYPQPPSLVHSNFMSVPLELKRNYHQLQQSYLQSQPVYHTSSRRSNPSSYISNSKSAASDAPRVPFSSISPATLDLKSEPVNLTTDSQVRLQRSKSYSDLSANYKTLKPSSFFSAKSPSSSLDEKFSENESESGLDHSLFKLGSQESSVVKESNISSLKNTLFNIKSSGTDYPLLESANAPVFNENGENLPSIRSLPAADIKTLFTRLTSFMQQKKSDNSVLERSKQASTNETLAINSDLSNLESNLSVTNGPRVENEPRCNTFLSGRSSGTSSDLQRSRTAPNSLPPIEEINEESIPFSIYEEFFADFIGHFQ